MTVIKSYKNFLDKGPVLSGYYWLIEIYLVLLYLGNLEFLDKIKSSAPEFNLSTNSYVVLK